MDKRNI